MVIIKRDTDYAIRALVQLSRQADTQPVSELAARERVPEHFLRKIMQRLHRAGIVESLQGPRGGYKLRRAPRKVTFWHILEAVQGPIEANRCFLDPAICRNTSDCVVRKKLRPLKDKLQAWLSDITLADVLKRMSIRKGKRS